MEAKAAQGIPERYGLVKHLRRHGKDALETLFQAFVELAQNQPLIRLTIHHQGANDAS